MPSSLVSPEVPRRRTSRVRLAIGFRRAVPRRPKAAPATRKHRIPTEKVTTSRISTPVAAAAAGAHHTAKKRPESRSFGSIAMNTPKPTAASEPRSRMRPMAVRMKLTRQYYRTGEPFNKSSPSGLGRSAPAHLAPVGFHVGEELVPGTRGALEAVAVEGELVDELVQRGAGVGDAARVGDDEDLPVLELLDVVYRSLDAGPVVEEVTGGSEVLVGGDHLVAPLGRVRGYGGALLLRSGQLALG